MLGNPTNSNLQTFTLFNGLEKGVNTKGEFPSLLQGLGQLQRKRRFRLPDGAEQLPPTSPRSVTIPQYEKTGHNLERTTCNTSTHQPNFPSYLFKESVWDSVPITVGSKEDASPCLLYSPGKSLRPHHESSCTNDALRKRNEERARPTAMDTRRTMSHPERNIRE